MTNIIEEENEEQMNQRKEKEVKKKKKDKKKKEKKKNKKKRKKEYLSNDDCDDDTEIKKQGDEDDVDVIMKDETSLKTTPSADDDSELKEKKRKKKKQKVNDEVNHEKSYEKKKKKKSKKSSKKQTNGDYLDTSNEKGDNSHSSTTKLMMPKDITATANKDDLEVVGGRIVSFSASIINEVDPIKQNEIIDLETSKLNKSNEEELDDLKSRKNRSKDDNEEDEISTSKNVQKKEGTSLLLFYQYIEPMLDEESFQSLLTHVQSTAEQYSIHGRARVAYEGLNCTLTGSYENIRLWCKSLRSFGSSYFSNTEFKLTDDLPSGQAFNKLHVFKVDEIVNYGLAGERAPKIDMTGVHLEPKDYHKKMMEDDTVIIDVRNHYEAAIGKFNPPADGAEYIDPNMRKSTEFPVWLDKPETKEMLRGKQVLMYCTGGVRCERASALLNTKIATEEDTKALGIKGVYQLQGGIDKYFRDFPEGGWWQGKNYVFDKRFAHAPPVAENLGRQRRMGIETNSGEVILSKCQACKKPWDKYRGKRRCFTCGVPLLMCKDCNKLDKTKVKKFDKVQCDLCVKEGITSKKQLRQKEQKDLEEYEKKLRNLYGFEEIHKNTRNKYTNTLVNRPDKNRKAPNPENITRLFLKNLNVKEIDQPQLCELVEGITHIEWLTDRNTQKWYGSVFVEVDTPENAGKAVGSLHKKKIYGRQIQCSFSKPDIKSIWPPPNSKIY